MGNKENKSRKSRKRKFCGNQYTNKEININSEPKILTTLNEAGSENLVTKDANKPNQTDDNDCISSSTSSKKLKMSLDSCKSQQTLNENCNNCNIFMDFSILKQVVELVGTCPDCSWTHEFYSSPAIPSKLSGLRGKKPFSINTRTVVAFGEIWQGFESLEKFGTLMNMPGSLSKSCNSINKKLDSAYTESAIESMQNAAQEVQNINNPNAKENDIVDSDICIDGSWQKRGHNSLNGVVTGISRENKKVLDVQIFSKFCHSCSKWESQKGTPEYEHWKMSHTCSKNHIGSAGSMESKGAINIFTNSLQKYNLRYAHYIGDGDTESYKRVTDTKPYGDFIPQKLECVGHVQKRLGTRLRKLRNEKKLEKLSDGKKISGKGRLTDKIINKMQNYYGMVIRPNPGRLFDMKKGIGAVLWHCSDITDPEARHQFCPKSIHSWCKY